MGRAPCCDKASVKKGPWSPEEDAKLKSYIEENGTGGNWIALPHKIGLKRCGKSCRLRWLNYLRPNIKHGDFTPEEDNTICSLYISIGSRWSIIAAQLPGRTDNDVKNYWNTKLKKRLLGRRKDSSRSPHNQTNGSSKETNDCSQNLSASALERIQLCMQLQGLQLPLFYPHNDNNNNNPSIFPNNSSMGQSQCDNSSNGVQNERPSNLSVAENGRGISIPISDGLLDGIDGFSTLSSGANSNVNSNVNVVEAELRGLLYGEEGEIGEQSYSKPGDGAIESMDWWDNYGNKSPVNSWSYSLDPNSLVQDYVPLYDM
ncbi:hypothetical protein LUZ60_008863 [Juncus effusus]|nr:hypothetical protein LUZ60_008863 [Juncus effusus]